MNFKRKSDKQQKLGRLTTDLDRREGSGSAASQNPVQNVPIDEHRGAPRWRHHALLSIRAFLTLI